MRTASQAEALSVLSPEQTLAAAMLKLAVSDARCGGTRGKEASGWLASSASSLWISLVTPDGMDTGSIQQRLIERATLRS